MWWWIAVSSAFGGMARYACLLWVTRFWTFPFPLATLTVNVLGSFLIGLIAFSPLMVKSWPPEVRDILILGVLGGFTTFSSFSLQTLMLVQQRQFLLAVGNVTASVFLCLAAAGLGAYIAGPGRAS